MSQKFHKGDRVSWDVGQGKTYGKITEYLTQSKQVEGQTIDASKDDPRYLVKNENTGNITGHRPETLSNAEKNGSNSTQSHSSNNSSNQSFQPGDRVKWNTAQGETVGKVVKNVSKTIYIKSLKVSASEDEPQYVVESEKTGQQAAHKPESLSKVS